MTTYVQLGKDGEIVREESQPFKGSVKAKYASRDGVQVRSLETWNNLCKVTSTKGDYTCEGRDELDEAAAAILSEEEQ